MKIQVRESFIGCLLVALCACSGKIASPDSGQEITFEETHDGDGGWYVDGTDGADELADSPADAFDGGDAL